MYGLPKRKHAANGGLIEGPGTGTSDSIKKDVPAGTYILPADTTAQLGLGMPGRKGQESAKGEQPRLGMPGKQVPVALSNGEYEMPPQDVHALGAVVLDQLKNATHQQKGFGLTKAVMAAAKGQQADGPRQFFADGGLVDDEQRRGFGVRMPTTTLMQPEQPRLGMPTRQPAGQESSTGSRALDVPLGAAQAVAGAVRTPIAAGQDAIRNAAAYIAGGDPATLPGGSTRYRDEAVGQFQAGVDRIGNAFSGVGEAARSALGVQPRQEQPAEQPRLGLPQPRQQVEQAQVEQPRLGMPGRQQAEWTSAGSGIAGRVGAGGVPEFTNAQDAVDSAVTSPDGVARVADGVGGGVVAGDDGDADTAIARLQRATAIRQQTLADNRGTVTGLTDERGRPSLADRQRSRLDLQNAQADALRTQTQQGSAIASQQLAAENQRMGTEQLNQQRLQQQIAEGDLGMQDRQRLEQLRAQIADPNLSEEERNVARQAYNVLATQAKDRYIAQDVVLGQGNNGPVIGRQIIDVTTGQPVAASGDQSQGLPQGVSREAAISEARAAIASGVSREAVNARLRQWGIDPV